MNQASGLGSAPSLTLRGSSRRREKQTEADKETMGAKC